ncbi:hypothetical protein IWX90DRAFT_496019 [Phyllosticta citrichinensis]|uniref:J domain-containing protein n=1 Tax=Phyllosticta citrichinensis TaxID=1130410 RepID=A0ABR1XFB4_9PEZI
MSRPRPRPRPRPRAFPRQSAEQTSPSDDDEQPSSSSSSSSSSSFFSEQSDSDALISQAPPSRTCRPLSTILIITCWFLVGLGLGYCVHHHHHHHHSPPPPTATTTAPIALFQPADFQILRHDNLLAFGVSRRPGVDGTDAQVAACQRKVRSAHRRLSKTWHPDSSRYRAVLAKWQCEELYRMVQERWPDADRSCLNRDMERQWEEDKRRESKMDEGIMG